MAVTTKPQRGAIAAILCVAPRWGLIGGLPPAPRAALWALTLRTFGAEYKCATSKLALRAKETSLFTAKLIYYRIISFAPAMRPRAAAGRGWSGPVAP